MSSTTTWSEWASAASAVAAPRTTTSLNPSSVATSYPTSTASGSPSPLRRVQRTTEPSSGSPDATPSAKGSAASAAVVVGAGVVVVSAAVVVVGAGVVGGAVVSGTVAAVGVGALDAEGPGDDPSPSDEQPATTVADRARNVRREIAATARVSHVTAVAVAGRRERSGACRYHPTR